MDIKVSVRTLVLLDEQSGKRFPIRTVRPIQEVAFETEEREFEEITAALEDVARKACFNKTKQD